jgi:hypothetical protein
MYSVLPEHLCRCLPADANIAFNVAFHSETSVLRAKQPSTLKILPHYWMFQGAVSSGSRDRGVLYNVILNYDTLSILGNAGESLKIRSYSSIISEYTPIRWKRCYKIIMLV